jgi:hypothetical protein
MDMDLAVKLNSWVAMSRRRKIRNELLNEARLDKQGMLKNKLPWWRSNEK